MRRGRRHNPFTQVANANSGKFSEKTYYNYSYSNHNGLKVALIAGAVIVTIAVVFIITKINSDNDRRVVSIGAEATPSPTAEQPQTSSADIPTQAPDTDNNDVSNSDNTDTNNPDDNFNPGTSLVMTSFSTIKQGDVSSRVQIMQERLIELGYLHIKESTTLYGAASVRAVTAFQRQHGLKKTGNANEKTLRLMFSADAKEYILKEGDKGDDVTQFQDELIELGYMSTHTGFYGSDTMKAVKDFQDYNGLKVTGIADRATIDKVYSHDARHK